MKNGINKNLPHTALLALASFSFVCACLCVVCYVAFIQDVGGVLSSEQNGGGIGGGHSTLGLSGVFIGEGRVEGTDHGSGGLRSKNGFREGGIAGSSGDEAREESVERERLVLGAGHARVLDPSDRGVKR